MEPTLPGQIIRINFVFYLLNSSGKCEGTELVLFDRNQLYYP